MIVGLAARRWNRFSVPFVYGALYQIADAPLAAHSGGGSALGNKNRRIHVAC
jgi:hypothetical protein